MHGPGSQSSPEQMPVDTTPQAVYTSHAQAIPHAACPTSSTASPVRGRGGTRLLNYSPTTHPHPLRRLVPTHPDGCSCTVVDMQLACGKHLTPKTTRMPASFWGWDGGGDLQHLLLPLPAAPSYITLCPLVGRVALRGLSWREEQPVLQLETHTRISSALGGQTKLELVCMQLSPALTWQHAPEPVSPWG